MTALSPANIRTGSVSGSGFVSKPALRFTLNGSDVLEHHLTNVCQEVLAGLSRIIPQHRLEGLALGGGYGRGEGGVLKTPAGDQPYNDLEFYVFVRGHPWWNEQRYEKSLRELSEELQPRAGIELEFKITSPARLRRSPPSLFYHDLVLGHRWLLGDDSLFAGCEHHRGAEHLPLSEATRLLMNRCSGLLFAREKLKQERFSAEDADFVCRNIAKTELALGDAVLIAFGKYHWSCLERGRRLSNFVSTVDWPWLEPLRLRHAAGVEFKLQPHRSTLSPQALQEQLCEVSSLASEVWLWLENHRLDCHFQTANDYASSRINKWPDTSRWRNCVANLKVFGPRALLVPGHQRHPRERILNALALLLWAEDETSAHQARRQLLVPEATAIIPGYRKRWSRAS